MTTKDYGWDEERRLFVHPQSTPYVSGPRPLPQSLDYLEDREYTSNMTVEARWPTVVRLTHTWQNVVDMGGRRYMFHYYRQALNVYDITDPTARELVLEKRYGPEEGEFGAAAIAYNKQRDAWILVQCFEVPRTYGPDSNKYADPAVLPRLMAAPGFRGFRVYELTGPTDWKLLAEVPTGPVDPATGIHQGSGGVDTPAYDGGRYMFIAAAPDDTFVNQEFATYPYTPAQLVYDMEDPAHPKLLSTWWVPGQRAGETDAYESWSRHGNRTSWIGARVPMSVPVPLEQGGRYGYAVMGGLGLYVLDLADPRRPLVSGHLDLPHSWAGIEGDVVDTSRVTSHGVVFVNGGPMNEDGYEPYKDIYVIDVKDPANPHIVATFPRPVPPAGAPYQDFVFRRGKFGPKRFGSNAHPGTADPNLTLYSFGNAGVQMFDLTDVRRPALAGYFVPKMTDELGDPRSYLVPTESIFVEWDRRLVWAFTNSGMYLLTSPLLGEPRIAR
ncbi:LVIVD repeat-containing protein [Streptosporangium sp. NPDC000095]|uniref:LVIVD repeat-containing protein n=1 Tax=Streptosporangium sp. NPDC000095 TaxID=3366184 RepID=UPI00367E88E0